MLVLPARQGRIHSLAYSPDGRILASGGEDGRIQLWNPAAGTAIMRPTPKVDGCIQCLAFSPDGLQLAFGDDQALRLWNLTQEKGIKTVSSRLPQALAFSSDGQMLAVGMLDGRLELRKMAWRALRQPERNVEFEAAILGVAFSPDNKTIALAGGNWKLGKVTLHDVSTGKQKAAVQGHGAKVFGVAFSPDGSTLATCSDDKTVRLWDAASGEEKAVLKGHEGTVSAVAFGADNRTVISVGWDGNVIFWDAITQCERANLEVHTGMINAVAFAPDGMTAATAGQDGSIVIWDVDYS